jgi:alpha-1,2-glucosyltransferase
LNGDFKAWDPKITTPPGLYYVQYAFSKLFGGELSTMRAINALIFSNIFLIFITKIYEFKDPNTNNSSRALNLSLTPTIYFFNFMDYTDTLSFTLITMAFYYNIVKSNNRLALTSLMALYVRQNNIIWVGFLMVYRILTEYKKLMFCPKPFVSHIFTIIKVVWNHKWEVIDQLKLQFLVIAVFFGYLKVFNSGHFVFGDRENHQMHMHPVQLLYLSLFMVINVPLNLDDYTSTFKQIFQKIFYSRHFLAGYLFILAVSVILVDKFTMVHEFTLADNRHFIFYLYRMFHRFWILKWLACLIYPLCVLFLFRVMVNS